MKTPQPRNARLSKPATPASKRASAAGPPSLYVSFDSGASAMLRCVGTMGVSKAGKGALGTMVEDAAH